MRLRTLTPADVDQRIAHVEQLAADGMRQALTSVTQAFDDRSSVVLAAALPGSRIWGALQEIFSVWRKTVEDKIMPYLQQTWQTAADDVIEQIQVDWPDYEAPPRAGDLMHEYLRRAENHMVGLSTELWENTRAALAEGVDAGEGIEQLAARVVAAADVTDFRARAVARTETARAAHAGTYDTIVAAGLTGMKEWVATEDDRTRPAHRLADGQRQPINELYVLYDPPALARYPVDWVLPASQSVNCRCDSVYDLNDEAIVASLAAFRFDPAQPRDGDGQWTDETPGVDPDRDKLGLASRIRLAPGQMLQSSGAFNDQGGDLALVMAVIDTPSGRRLRLGTVDREAKKSWRAADRGSTVELDETQIAEFWDELQAAPARVRNARKQYLSDVKTDPQLSPEDERFSYEKIIRGGWADVHVSAAMNEGDLLSRGVVNGEPYVGLEIIHHDPESVGGRRNDDFILTPGRVTGLLKMLDTLVSDADQLTSSGWRAAFRFNPSQPRDDDGKWTDGAPGTNQVDDWGRLPDGSVPTRDEFGGDDPTDPKRDKLGLASRIRLAGGERLLSSGAVNADEGAFVMAVVDTPQGRRLRIGQVAKEDKKAWSGDNGAEIVEDEDTGDRLELPSIGSTAELDEAGISALWDALERAADELPATLKRYNADAREVRRREAAGGAEESLHPEDDAYEVLDEKISGTRWGDVEAHAYLAEGDDPEDAGPMKGRPAFYLKIQEHGEPSDSDLLTLRGIQAMLKMLDTLVADTGEIVASAGRFDGFLAWRAAYDLAQGGAR